MTFLLQNTVWNQAEVRCPVFSRLHFSTGRPYFGQTGTAGWPCLLLSPYLCFAVCLCQPASLPPLQVSLESPPSINHMHKHLIPASASREPAFSSVPSSLSAASSHQGSWLRARGSCCNPQSLQLNLAFRCAGDSAQVEVIALLLFSVATCGCSHISACGSPLTFFTLGRHCALGLSLLLLLFDLKPRLFLSGHC